MKWVCNHHGKCIKCDDAWCMCDCMHLCAQCMYATPIDHEVGDEDGFEFGQEAFDKLDVIENNYRTSCVPIQQADTSLLLSSCHSMKNGQDCIE